MAWNGRHLRKEHARLNRSTRDAWARYQPHRERVMGLIPERGGSLALLGAGNCNDVDLEQLVERFGAVTLVDIDVAACDAAIARLAPPLRDKCRVQVAELSGVGEALDVWKASPPSAELLRKLPEEHSKQVSCGGPFDVVVSSGVLSQLAWSCVQALGPEHPALRPVAVAAAVAHLRLAVDRVAAGGTLVLAIDAAARSGEFFAELGARMSTTDMLVTLEAAIGCTPGTEVAFVRAALGHLLPGATVTMAEPWLWAIDATRHALVYGVVASSG